jgi:prenyltransferase beta subunit
LYFISYILSMCQYTTQSDKDEEVNYIKQKYVYN